MARTRVKPILNITAQVKMNVNNDRNGAITVVIPMNQAPQASGKQQKQWSTWPSKTSFNFCIRNSLINISLAAQNQILL